MTEARQTKNATAHQSLTAPLSARQWLYLGFFLCLVTMFYSVEYWTNPVRPGLSTQYPQGWWGWFDQGQYFKSVVALEQHNYDPLQHHYPIGYPLIGTLFYSLMPQHAFLIPDFVFCIVTCLAFIDLCRRVVSFRAALLLCFFGAIWCTTVLENFVYPWTTIPASAALMTLAALVVAPERDRRRSILTGVCAATIFAVRPGDVVYAWPLAAGLWLGCNHWREALQRARWFAIGAVPITAVMLYYSFTIHGALLSRTYTREVGRAGFGFASWGLKLYTFFIDSFVIFGDAKTLITVFPLLFFVLPGIAVFIRKLQWRGLAIVLSQLLCILYFLAFNNHWVYTAFKYLGIHYWQWLIPFVGLYAFLTFTQAWRSLGLVAPSLLIAVPLVIWASIRMEIRPVFTATAPATTSSATRPGQNPDTTDSSQGSASWRCVPDVKGSCTISLELAEPITFNMVKLSTSRAADLLFAPVFIDGHPNRMFYDHYLGTGGDGQPVIVFYRRQRGRSLRVTILNPPAPNTTATKVQFYQYEFRLTLRNPLRNYFPASSERL